MDEYTTIAKDIETIREKARLDECCKRILANKVILSWIMKECRKYQQRRFTKTGQYLKE